MIVISYFQISLFKKGVIQVKLLPATYSCFPVFQCIRSTFGFIRMAINGETLLI